MTRPLIYLVMEAAADDPRLTATERLALLYLTKAADQNGTNCTLSNDSLGRLINAKRPTVRRAVSRLRDLGYVERRRRRWDSARTTIVRPQEVSPGILIDSQEVSPAIPMDSQEVSLASSRGIASEQQRYRQRARTGPVTDPVTEESSSSESIPFSRILEMWNTTVPPPVARMRSIEGKRQVAIRACVGRYGVEGVLELIARVATSSFLTGKVEGTRWHGRGCDCDWPFKATNAQAILEGKYDTAFPRTAAPAPAPSATAPRRYEYGG